MKQLLLLLCLVLPFSSIALNPIEIINPEALIHAKSAREHRSIWRSLKNSDFSKEQLKMIEWYGKQELRPPHLQERIHEEDRPYFSKMNALEVLTDSIEGISLIMIPAPENLHLPKEIRPLADLYMVMPTNAFTTGAHWPRLPSVEDLSNGPAIDGLSRMKINDPAAVYGRIDLRSDKDIESMLHKIMGYRAVDHVQVRCNESGWPSGMNTLAERDQLGDEIKKYKAYALTQWDDKILLIVPAAKNKHINRRARPMADIYLVIDSKGI
jgi:hypothetical protein